MSSNYAYALEWWDTGFLGVALVVGDAWSGLFRHQAEEPLSPPVPELDETDDEDTVTTNLFSDASPLNKEITENSMPESTGIERQVSAERAALAFRRLLGGLEGVESILASETPEGVIVSVVANNPSREHRRKIFDREWDLMQRYLGTAFDFHLIDRRDRPLCDVVSVDNSDIYVRM